MLLAETGRKSALGVVRAELNGIEFARSRGVKLDAIAKALSEKAGFPISATLLSTSLWYLKNRKPKKPSLVKMAVDEIEKSSAQPPPQAEAAKGGRYDLSSLLLPQNKALSKILTK